MNSKLESLIEECRRREPRAQRELYDKLAPAMLAVCQRYMKDREAAKDVMQDGFVRLFDKISSYKGDGSFEGWARKLFVNTALMQLRRNDALKFSDNIEDSQAMQMTHSNTLEKMGADEILELVNSMPDGFRTVFNLYVIEGYSHEEIAGMLSISEGGSRSQLSHARAWLRKKLL
ncbi:MAG: sigma-70 family RNA polymerase sigma factor [Bacteroidales bacterium]|nr:sigma-70 family RNA polymerase sigma factor [Bacteroidales bacterium]